MMSKHLNKLFINEQHLNNTIKFKIFLGLPLSVMSQHPRTGSSQSAYTYEHYKNIQ